MDLTAEKAREAFKASQQLKQDPRQDEQDDREKERRQKAYDQMAKMTKLLEDGSLIEAWFKSLIKMFLDDPGKIQNMLSEIARRRGGYWYINNYQLEHYEFSERG